MSDARVVRPEGWPRPSGYSDVLSTPCGRSIWVSGQVGWDPVTARFATDDFAAQCEQALRNVATALAAADARPADVVRLTWYVTDRGAYLAARVEVGRAYRAIFGTHYPAMSVVVVAGLLEPRAQVEIEATAVVP